MTTLVRSAFGPDRPLLKALRLLRVPHFHLLRLLRMALLGLLLSALILLLAGLILLLSRYLLLRPLILFRLLLLELLVFLILFGYQLFLLLLILPVPIRVAAAGRCDDLVLRKLARVGRIRRSALSAVRNGTIIPGIVGCVVGCSGFSCGDNAVAAECSWPVGRSDGWLAVIGCRAELGKIGRAHV